MTEKDSHNSAPGKAKNEKNTQEQRASCLTFPLKMEHFKYGFMILLLFSSMIPLAHGQQLIEVFDNGDFEDGDDGVWGTSGTADIQSGIGYQGTYGGVLLAPNDWLRQPNASVWNDGSGGIQDYTILDFYGCHDGAGAHNLSVIIDYHDETYDLFNYSLTNSWAYYNIMDDVNTSLGIYDFRFQSPVGSTVNFYLDDVRFFYEAPLIPEVHGTGFQLLGDWIWRQEILIEHEDIDEDLNYFPVYVYLDSSSMDWDRVEDDLSDIRFADAENNLYYYEVANYTVNEEAHLWVRLPLVNSTGDTLFYLIYGNPDAVDQSNPSRVWEEWEHVYHMTDLTDRSGNGHTLTNTGADSVEGFVYDGAYDLDGSDYLNPASYTLTGGDTLMLEVFLNSTSQAFSQTLAGDNAQWGTLGYLWCVRGSGSDGLTWEFANGVNPQGVTDADFWTGYDDAPVYAVVVANYTSEDIQFYRNGVNVYTTSMTTSIYPNRDTIKYLGAYSPSSHRLHGFIDEWRLIEDFNASATWIEASYLTLTDDLLSFGELEMLYEMSLLEDLFFGEMSLFMFLIYAGLILLLVFKFKSAGIVFSVLGGFLLGYQYLSYVGINAQAYWYFIGSILLMLFSILIAVTRSE